MQNLVCKVVSWVAYKDPNMTPKTPKLTCVHMNLMGIVMSTRVGRDIENQVLRLLPKGDLRLLQHCNYLLILSMIAKIGSFLKDDTSGPWHMAQD